MKTHEKGFLMKSLQEIVTDKYSIISKTDTTIKILKLETKCINLLIYLVYFTLILFYYITTDDL